MNFTIERRNITRWLTFLMLLLILAHIGYMVLNFHFEVPDRFGIFRLFDLGKERNFPTYFSSVTLLICSCLLFLIHTECRKINGRYGNHWKLLSFIFIYLSVDEFVVLHERLIGPMKRIIGPSDFFYHAWVIPFGIFVLFLSIAYFKFIWHLPGKVRTLSILAAVFYLSGALVVETMGGYYLSVMGLTNKSADGIYSSFQLVEESLEMLGILVYINALLLHLELAKSRRCWEGGHCQPAK